MSSAASIEKCHHNAKTTLMFRISHCVGDGHAISRAFADAFDSSESFSYEESFLDALKNSKYSAKIPSSIWNRALQFFYMIYTILAVLIRPFLPKKQLYWIYENKAMRDEIPKRAIASSVSIPISTVCC